MRRRWLVVAAALLAAAGAAVWADVEHAGLLSRLDGPAEAAGVRWRAPALTALVLGVTDSGATLGRIAVAAAVAVPLAVRRGTPAPVVAAAAAIGLAPAASATVKRLVGRARPPAELAVVHPDDPSFPSGHATGAAALAVVLAGVVVLAVRSRRARALAVLLAAAWAGAVGVSRVYLGAHWATDVLAGWCTGGAVGLLVLAAALPWLRRVSRPVDERTAVNVP